MSFRPSGYRIPDQPYSRRYGSNLYLPARIGSVSAFLDAGAGGAYDWTQDTQIYARFKAGNLNNLAAAPVWGNLTSPGGAVTVTPNGIGSESVWSFTKGASKRLLTSNTSPHPGPYQIFLIARSTTTGGAPAAGDYWLSDGGQAGGGKLEYQDATSITSLNGNGSGGTYAQIQNGGTANFHLYNIFVNGGAARSSVDGAAYITAPSGNANVWNGMCIGALPDGTISAGLDVAEVIIVEGQCSAALIAGITAYVRQTYPSLGVALTPPAVFSVAQTVLSVVTAPFDFIVTMGQSNNGNFCTAATTTPGANTYLFDSSNTFSALRLQYDNLVTATIDTVQSRGTGAGGNATKMATDYAAGTGRPVVIVPCSSGGSGLSIQATNGNAVNTWQRDAPNGRAQNQRDTLYWSAVARVQNMLALGGVFRFISWYQGEDEAQNGPISTFAADTLNFLTSFCNDCGIPQRIYIQPIANTVGLASAPNIAAIQAAQASLALAGVRIVGTPYGGTMEADTLHVPAAGLNTMGAAMAAAALAQSSGWH